MQIRSPHGGGCDRFAAMDQPRLLLIISGGIAAYKSLEFIRRARDAGFRVRAIMTKSATQFVTPLSVGAITGDRVFTDLFDRDDEHDIGHIRLSREADLIVVAPATADLMAKMAGGHADDLASTVLMASDKPVLIAPAMNPRMWSHPATQRNIAMLEADGVHFVGPEAGEMAETGESGVGRMSEPTDILAAAQALLAGEAPRHGHGPLAGRRLLITAGPTHEPIDPVRYIANRSSGKQGYAIAAAAARAGADVTLISGPTGLAAPAGVTRTDVETAEQMLQAVEAALPSDAAIFTAAVADWRVDRAADQKLKKSTAGPPDLPLRENPDILATVARRAERRPPLVVGFAAETEKVVANATSKRERKQCDWIVANDVSLDGEIAGGVMGGDRNKVHLIRAGGSHDAWPVMTKDEVARRLVAEIADWFAAHTDRA
jgi:phosphopantothenoylcysteine decarboxylase/phosphopantothenate--cysteine ligase